MLNLQTLHNPMNPHTGRPIEVTIQKPIMKVGNIKDVSMVIK